MTWPETLKDTVLYAEREFIADRNLTLRMIDKAKFDFIGDIDIYGKVNGRTYTVPPFIDVREYGANGDGSNETALLQAAINEVVRVKGVLVVSPGTYNHTGLTFTSGTDVSILGMGGTLYETTGTTPHLTFNTCTNVRVLNLNVSGAPGNRTSGSRGLNILTCSDVLIQGCTVKDPRGGGIYIAASSFVRVIGNKVYNSMADGIHMTGASHHITVTANETDDTGDDCIAVVSYISDGAKCTDVTISGNVVRNGAGRGITSLGGDRIVVANNVIDNMYTSGMIFGRDTPYNTYGNDSVTITGNIMKDVALAGATNGITINFSDVYRCDNIVIRNNLLMDCRYRGIRFIGVGNGMRGGVIEGNVIIRCNNSPIGATSGQGLIFSKNTLIDCGESQFSILPGTNTMDVVVSDNVCLNPNPSAAANIRFISSENDTPRLTITGNRVDGGTIQVMYRIPATTNAIIRDNLRDGVVVDNFNGVEPVVANRGTESVWSNQIFKGNIGFYGTTPVIKPTSVTARAALEALGLGATLTPELKPVVPLATVTSTAALVQAGSYIRFTGAAPNYTLPANSVIAFPINTEISGTCTTGPMTIVQGAGAVVNKARTLVTVGAFSGWTATKVNTDEWDVHGDFV